MQFCKSVQIALNVYDAGDFHYHGRRGFYLNCRFQRKWREPRAPTSVDTSHLLPLLVPRLLHRRRIGRLLWPRHLLGLLTPPHRRTTATTTLSPARATHTTASAIPTGRRQWAVQRVTTLVEISGPTTAATTTTPTTARYSLLVDNATLAGAVPSLVAKYMLIFLSFSVVVFRRFFYL